MNIAPRWVNGLLQQLHTYHQQFTSLWQRRAQRHWSRKYLEGQMLELERKSIEPMAQALEGGNVQALQQFISDSPWDDEPIIEQHQALVAETLGAPEGLVILDGCEFPKQGADSVGVAPQYCGALGKLANCQASVLLAYASERGQTLLDRRLYLPDEWFDDDHRERWAKCGIPDVGMQTKPELGWAMLETLLARAVVPFSTVAMDASFGRDTHLLNQIAAANKQYFAAVDRSLMVWLKRPQVVEPSGESSGGRPPTRMHLAPEAATPMRVDLLVQSWRRARWKRVIVREGSKGPLAVEIAMQRVVCREDALPARDEWLIVRRASAQQPLRDWKFFRSNAPADTPFNRLARLTAWRWPIETVIEECKGELGLDHYEVRGWRGWHHHLTMTMLAHHFLVGLRVDMGAEAPALTVSQARRLLQVTLPKREFDAEAALAEIERIQQQNHAAYCSHRKQHWRDIHSARPT
jgi:SRSO17 transposase